MASTLAQQLAQLQVVKGPQAERHVHGKLSLLFDYQKAADISAEQLLALAQQGLETLCKADKRFTPFQDSLFSRASLSLSRDQLTKEESSQLDASLRAFLHVLTNHFLVPAAFQALEYCIRRYKAHVHNVGDLFVCALPYHSTPEFARLVAVLQLQGTPWEWLSPCQQTGAPPPRPLLVQACVNHQAVLREICRGAQSLGVAGFVSRTYLSFYAVLLCEVLMAAPQVTEDLLALLLPFLVSGLQESATRDYRAATLMVLTQLLSRASLSKDFLTVVSVEVCRSAGDLGYRTALMLLAHLAGSQPHLKSLPAKALLLLAEQHEEAGQQLAELQTKGANLARLLQLLLHSLSHQVPGNPQLQPLLLDLLQKVQQDPLRVQATVVQLLRAGCKRQQQQAAAGNSQDIKPLQAVLRVLDSRYPDQLDAAVNQVLQEAGAAAAVAAAAAAAAAGGKSGGSSQSHGKQRHHPVDADSLFEFVQRCFHGSSHEVVTLPSTAAAATDGAAHQQQALTLSLAVSAPAYQMRIMGLKKLDAICIHAAAAGGGGDDGDGAVAIPVPSSTRQLLHSSLLSCLRDDVFAVAGTAAAAAGLAEVPLQEQLPALQSLLTRAAETLAGSSGPLAGQVVDVDGGTNDGSSGGNGSSEKDVLKAAKTALAAVAAAGQRAAATAAAAAADGNHEQAAAAQLSLRHAAVLLLEHVLADKRTKKLAKAAVGVAATCNWHPLLALLSSSPEVSAALGSSSAAAAGAAVGADAPAASDSKRRKKKQDANGAATAAAADGGKHTGGALALNRAVVDALASAVTASVGPPLLPELTSLVADGACGRCCQHLVMLVLIRAAAVATAAAQAAGVAGTGGTVSPDVPPPTPSRGRGKAKQQQQQRHGSRQDVPAAATALAYIAAALVTLLEQTLVPAAAAGRQSSSSNFTESKHKAAAADGGVSAEVQPPDNWADLAAEYMDAMSLPTKKHLQQLHSELQQVNLVLLLAGVKSVLAAATADSLVDVLGQPAVVFSRLAAAAVQGHVPLLQHLHLIAATVGQGPQQQLDFLAGIFGLPQVSRKGRAARGAEAAQAAALQLLCWQPDGSGGTCRAAAASVPGILAAGGSSWFLQLLAAMDSSSKVVRAAAVDALFVLPERVSSTTGWQLAGGFAAEQLQQLVSGLRVHEALLRDSAGVVSSLLCSAAAGGGAAAAVETEGSGGRTSRASSKAKHGKAGVGRSEEGDDASAAAELQLPGDCVQALQRLLVAVLPQLQAPSQLLAAQLSAAALSAGGGGVAAGAVAAASSQLLRQLVVALCSDGSRDKKHGSQQPVWQQLAELQGGPAAVTEAQAVQHQLQSAVAVSLTGFFSAAALQAEDGADAGAIVDGFVSLLQLPFEESAGTDWAAAVSCGEAGRLSDAQLASIAPVRAAALQQLDAAVFETLPTSQQQIAFSAVLRASATDGDSSCRAAARSALERIPVTADMLLVLFNKVGGNSNEQQEQQLPNKGLKRQKRAGSSQGKETDIDEEAASLPVLASDLDSAIAALELLLWKDDVADVQQLVQPLQRLLRLLVPVMGSIVESHHQSASEQQQVGGEVAAVDAAVASASAAGYAASLVLLVLRQLAQEQLQQSMEGTAARGRSRGGGAAAGPAGVDADLVLSCASAAPDGAVRNAALQLLTVLAQVAPQDMLGHVLQALSVVQQSAALQEDSHSQAVASATLAALVPAWLASGKGSQELWTSLIDALPGLPALRRLALLSALLAALPEEMGLSVGLLLMMKRVVAGDAAAAGNAVVATGSGKQGTAKKAVGATASAAQLASSGAADGVDGAGGGASEMQWLPDLMAALCDQVAVPQRLRAFAAVLQSSLQADAAGGAAVLAPAHAPLPRLAVVFVTTALKAKSVAAAAHSKGMPTVSNDEAAAVAADIQTASRSIMSLALLHLQQLNPSSPAEAAAGTSSGKTQRKMHKATRAAAAGVYELLAALEAVQDCSTYLSALVDMSRQQAASVVRHALKLLAARLSTAEVDLADLEAEQLPAADRSVLVQQLAEAGLAVCSELPRLMQSDQPMTRQLALVAGEAAIRKFGQLLPSAALSSLPVVLAAVQDGSGPVRVSALVFLATSAAVLGTKLVPLLPQTAAAVLAAAQNACQDLAGFSHQQHAAAKARHAVEAAGDQAAAEIDGDGDDDAVAGSSGSSSSGENAALQLAGALAALQAMVSSLAAFMSPYLKSLLQLLLHQQVLSCSTADAAAVAQGLRAALPGKIPARLLLDPVLSQWDYALAACGSSGGSGQVSPAPALALLELMAGMAAAMEPSTAVMFHEKLLGVLLRALDTRHRWLLLSSSGNGQQQQVAAGPAAAGSVDAVAAANAVQQLTANDIHVIEQAAVRALAATVMKLSESKFKPLFLRMQEWATTSSSSAVDASSALSVGRAAAFLAAVNIFGQRLRSVFVPYYRYYSTLLMKHLVDDGGTGGSGDRRAKKKRKSSVADSSVTTAAAASEALQLSRWLARLRAVRAVHLLAIHESATGMTAVQQEQQERFERLLPLVVEQLAAGPPAGVAAVLADEGADSLLDLPGGAVAALGPVGKAVVEAGGAAALQDNVDMLGRAALGALLQMAVAGGSDVTWKPLHHALLMVTRGGSVRAKLLALGGVSRLAELLKEEYLMLLPEALPFVSELIEDGDVTVEGAAQGLVAQLEELSGEKLEQYLKT